MISPLKMEIEMNDQDLHEINSKTTLTDFDESEIIDYVLVYNESNSSKSKDKLDRYRLIYLENLTSYGLKLKIVKSDKKIFVLIHTPFDVLLEIAEKTKLNLPIEINDLETESTMKSAWNRVMNLFSSKEALQINKTQNDYFTAPYTRQLHDQFAKYFNKENRNKSILEKDRIYLTYQILCRTSFTKSSDNPFLLFSRSKNEGEFGIEKLIDMKVFNSFFPLHQTFDKKNEQPQRTERQDLWNYWANPRTFTVFQPLHLIREYFGEKLGFYFAWLGFYTASLILPAIIGVAVFIYGLVNVFNDIPTNEICDKIKGNITMCPLCDDGTCSDWKLYENCLYARLSFIIDNPSTVFFSVFMSVWSVILIDLWRRKQSRLHFEWDTPINDKFYENIRPQFEKNAKDQKKNYVTGEMESHQSLKRKFLSYIATYSIVLIMVILVLSFLLGTILYRSFVRKALNIPGFINYSSILTSTTAALINLIVICILSFFYSWLAVKLTDIENHKTDSEYEGALTLKMYLFQFANFYSTIFYIGFFKGKGFQKNKIGNYELTEQCDQSGCLAELFIQLATILIGKQILNNMQEVVIPYFKHLYKKKTLKHTKSVSLKNWQRDLELLDWGHLTLFDEYLEMIIQFGLITMFAMAFPLGPLFAFLNNIFEIKIDSFKYLVQTKRPALTKSTGIGIWLPILNTISKLTVITNGFLIAFTSDFIPRLFYLIGKKKSNLTGYVDFTLSVKNSSSSGLPCRYKDFKIDYSDNLSYEYWEILAAKFIFVCCFEHFVFALVGLMHVLIPNTPKLIKNQIEREKLIWEKIQWEIQSQNNNSSEIIARPKPMFLENVI